MSDFKDSVLNPKNWFLTGKDKARFNAKRRFYGESLDRALVDIEHTSDSVGLKIAHLDVDKKYNKVTESEYEKNKATLLDDPYITVVKVHINSENAADGFMELDWNDAFIKSLVDAGFVADSQEAIIKLWFDEICANVARENGAVFPEEVEEFKHKTARRVKSENGKIEVM